MDYNELNDRLRTLADSYSSARRSGTGLVDTLTRTASAALPAASALRRLTDVLFGHSDIESKGVQEVRRQLGELQTQERQANVLVRNLQRRLSELDRQRVLAEAADNAARTRIRTLTQLQQQGKAAAGDVERLKQLRRELATNAQFMDDTDRRSRHYEDRIAVQTKQLVGLRTAFADTARDILSTGRALDVASKSAVAAVEAAGIGLAVRQSLAFNRTLREANSDINVRSKLLADALKVQMQTGDSLGDIADIMREVRAQTQLYDKDLVDVVATASKLRQTLGASDAQIGVLLNTSRQLHVSLHDTGDLVANIVNRTALSAGDAVDVIRELRDVLASYNVSGSRLQDATRYVAALEQSLREVGAEAGLATKIVTNFSDLRRKGGLALAFGSGGLDVATDPRRFQQLTQNVVSFLRPWRDNMLVFTQLAESFGLTAREAQNLIDAQGRVAQTDAALASQRQTLDQRFREQAAASGAVYGQLLNNLKALLVDGLAPVTYGVAKLNAVLVRTREVVTASVPDWARSTARIVASGLAIAALGLAITRVIGAFRLVRSALEGLAAFRTGATLAGAVRAGTLAAATPSAAQAAGSLATQVATTAAATTIGSKLATLLGRQFTTSTPGTPPRGAGGRFAPYTDLSRWLERLVTRLPDIPTISQVGRWFASLPSLLGRALSSIPSAFRSLRTLISGRALSTAVAGAGSAGGLVPFIVASLPAILGAAMPIVLAYVLGRVVRSQLEDYNASLIRDAELMRRTRSAQEIRQEVGTGAAKALDDDNVTTALDRFAQQSKIDRAVLQSNLRRGDISLQAVLEGQAELKAQLERRLVVQTATINRELPTAPTERRDELERGLRALLGAVQDLQATQEKDTTEYQRIAREGFARTQAQQQQTERRSSVLNITNQQLVPRRDAGGGL